MRGAFVVGHRLPAKILSSSGYTELQWKQNPKLPATCDTEPPLLEQMPLFGLHLPSWLLPGIGLFFWALALVMQARRKTLTRGRMGTSIAGRLLKPLPSDLQLFATIGETGQVQDSLGTLTLQTTPGLRLVWLAISILLVYVSHTTPGLWQLAPITSDTLIEDLSSTPPPVITLLLFSTIALSAIGIFGFELRMDSTTLNITRYFYRQRQFSWDDLIAIEDNGQYDYILLFRSGQKAKVTKYLVGTPQLLKFIGSVLEQNEAVNAGTTRS
jgi:hypothetical protein